MLSLLEMSVYGGILIVAIVILRALAIHHLPKNAFLVLWAAALCRLLLPFDVPSPASIYRTAEPIGSIVRRPGVLQGNNVVSVAEASAGIAPLSILWFVLFVLFAGFFIFSHLRSRRDYRASLPLEHPYVKSWLEAHRLRRPVQVRYSDQIETPLTYGILWPVILLPKSLDWSDEVQLSYILAHEMAHIRRFDALSKWLLAATLCIHWFNPLVWVMYVLANRDLELSCDASVVRQYGMQSRAPYALTLVDLEEHRSHFAPLSSSFSKNAMKERITAIMKSRKTSVISITAASVLIVVVIGVFATSAPSLKRKPPVVPYLPTASTADTLEQAQNRIDSADWEENSSYTQEQYNLLLHNLKLDGYENMSISEFNRKINAAFMQDEDWGRNGIHYAYEMVLQNLPDTDPNASFFRNTVQASYREYNTRLNEVRSGMPEDPSFSGSARYVSNEDVFGDTIPVHYVDAEYEFTYRILDQDKLTVAARDQFLQNVMQGAQQVITDRAQEFFNSANAEELFNTALREIGKTASTDHISFTGCKINYLESD
ncbi:M56 family metallopeptidase [Anaeromassilibacillus senegalensis]|uniref:M56 family metallopeptidase n=1 Tax=Anaeromassilibacillus senegalensis TaxID=1673717 RepID=UPI00067F95BA|nr:M56 family metallopeptidase [Anaeromassilibacillus senegalensis]